MTSSVVENTGRIDEGHEIGTATSELPLDRLEAELIGMAGHLAAATAQWLVWLGHYDRREGWQRWACRSAAHWLSWKCGMSLGTARTHVRVARALAELPLVAAAFAAGQLSFSKVRALTRLAHPIDEAVMVDVARWSTASQLDRLVAGCVSAESRREGRSAPTKPSYRARTLDDGMVEITVTVSGPDAQRIRATVDAVSDRVVAERGPGVSSRERVAHLGGWNAIRAEAATSLLTATAESPAAEPVELTIDVELQPATVAPPADPGNHAEHRPAPEDRLSARMSTSGRHLPAEVVRRLGCDAVIAVSPGPVIGPTDRRIGVGRRQRVVPAWLRRQLERRDNHCCRFPGCATTRRLHAHHIVHWSNGGPTGLGNLLLLCSFHHHVVHEGGWSIRGTAEDHVVLTPDGTRATIPQVEGDLAALDPFRPEQPHAVVALWDGQPLDIHYAVSVLADHQERHEQHHRPVRGIDPTLN